jgi:hypothetical protein
MMSDTIVERLLEVPDETDNDHEGAPLLKPLLSGKGGAQAVRRYYGTDGRSPTQSRLSGHHSVSYHGEDARSPGEGSSSTVKPNITSDARPPSPKPATDNDSPRYLSSPASSRSSRSSSPLTGPRHGFTEDLVQSGDIQKIIIRTTTADDKDKDSAEHSPVSSTAPRQRTWSFIDKFSNNSAQERDGTSRSSTEPVTKSVGSVAKLVDNPQPPIQAITPLVVVPDTSSPVEVPLAQAIEEPAAEPVTEQPPEPPAKAQAVSTSSTNEPPAEAVKPPLEESPPPSASVISPIRSELYSSSDLSLKSPIDGAAEEEDLEASTATLGASSSAGGNGSSNKRKNKKKKKKGKGTTF